MKKFSSNSTLVSLVLGILMVLFGMQYLDTGVTAAVIIGVFGLVFGIAYILAGVLSLLGVDNNGVTLTKGIIHIAGFPIFIFVLYLVFAIQGAFVGVSDWILGIILLAAALGSGVMGIVFFFVKNEALMKILRLVVLLFLCIYIVLMIFPLGGGTASIGDISIVSAAFVICYYILSKNVIDPKEE